MKLILGSNMIQHTTYMKQIQTQITLTYINAKKKHICSTHTNKSFHKLHTKIFDSKLKYP